MKEALVSLVKVKSIVTILLSIVFCYLAIVGIIDGSKFMTVFTVIISFYFGTQQNRKKEDA